MPSSINANDLGRVVRVEYDYQYKANDGRFIKITEGEEFVLIKKSNEDWWQVVSKGQKKPLYIPAAYVRELQLKKFLDHPFFKKAHNALLKTQKGEGIDEQQGDQKKPKKTTQRLSDGPQGRERMIVVTGSREDLNVLTGFTHSKFSEMRASTDSLDKFIENENPYDVVPIEPLKGPKIAASAHEVKPSAFQYEEDPDYENLSDFTSAAKLSADKKESYGESNHSQIEPKRDSGNKNPPAVSKKPSFRRPDLPSSPVDSPHTYANLQGQSIRPALPMQHSPESATTVEVFEDGWELQLDTQTGNKYYYNPSTGSMRVKPPRRTNRSPEPKGKSQQLNVPEPDQNVEAASRKQTKSPVAGEGKRASRPSPLQRRKTSPARFKNPKKAPFLKKSDRKHKNDENTSPNENNSNNFFPPAEAGSSPTALEASTVQASDQLSSPALKHKGQWSHSRASSGTSRSLSPDDIITVSESGAPTPAGWMKERSSDGDTVLVNRINGDRWIQFYDKNSGSYYYCSEQTRVTLWELPLIENIAPSEARGTTDQPSSQPSSPGSSSKSGRASASPHGSPSAMKDDRKSSLRKSKTLDRDGFLRVSDAEIVEHKAKSSSLPWPKKKAPKVPPTPPPATSKPRAGRTHEKHLSKRMLHSQSMIILDDHTPSGMYSFPGHGSAPHHKRSDSEQNETVTETTPDRGSLLAPPPHPMIERQGRLNWTKLAEAGKKTKKNWVQQWVVLLSNNLLFYKDQKQASVTKANPLGKPDSSCELRGATIELAKEKSSKKNVYEVRTIRGTCFLLQHDDVITIREWYKSIEATIKRAHQVDPLDHSLLTRKDSHGSTEDESMENHIPIDSKDKKKKEKEKKKDKKGKPPSRHGSDARNSDKVRSKLKKFIGRRPTMESLQERGLIKETVFGCPLQKLCEKEGTTIPVFVKRCVEEVEKRGIEVDGIYRVSGNLSHVQKLRYMVDREIEVNLGDHEWEDIHVITGALKMFLRELPEPVIPFNFFDKFIATCKISEPNSRRDATKCLVKALPKPNRETLKYLMQHFSRVVSRSEKNRMQVQNVAIVFGPTLLLKPPEVTNHHDPGGGHMAIYMMYQNQIVDYMLTEFNSIFS